MFTNVGDNRIVPQCPVVGGFEDALWNVQCPITNQWGRGAGVYADTRMYPMREPTMHCYNNGTFFNTPGQLRQHYFAQRPFVQQVYSPPMLQQSYIEPLMRDLPCHQQNQQAWDYNNMCFDVDGQPCQYTNIVDLEDFMNNEKRKEKSRVAARCRRTKEMQIFGELTAAIPAKKEEVEQLDKASVMRLAISFLRTREVVAMLPDVPQQSEKLPKAVPEDVSSELSYMKALDGFVLVLSQQGDIVYCSENISEHLGVSQIEIMGQSVFEFSHPCDHDEIRDALRTGASGRRDLLLRLKCTLTSKGRSVHLKSASYKVIHVTGHMLTSIEDPKKSPEPNNNTEVDTEGDLEKKLAKISSLVAVGRPIPHPSNIEIPLGTKTFLSKHSLDMKFTYTDNSLKNSLGFEPEELVGRHLYEYHHAGDSAALSQNFKSLFSKGQCETGQYRFLAKYGGYAWVQTQATLITDKQQKPISIVCVNYVVSGIEYKDEVFAAHQLQYAEVKPNVAAVVSTSSYPPDGAVVAIVPPEEERPKPATELIFAPRTKEMNKGFLTFQDEGVTMLKDEPEDLTHLAPTAGDACIPLENSTFDNMFEDFILNDNNYCSLLGDDLGNGSPVDSLAADSLLLSSPEPLETDSSCEPSILTEFSLDAIENGQSENELEDGKSPFIPHGDELAVIAPAVMWGALPDSVSMARPQPSESQATSPAPALQRLLAGPPTGPPPQDLITNIYSYQDLMPNKGVTSWDTGAKRVLKQDEEPSAKRAKRSPSPAKKTQQTSSVLMNLLDVPKSMSQQQPSRIGQNFILEAQKLSPRHPVSTLNRNIPQMSTISKTLPLNYRGVIPINSIHSSLMRNSGTTNPTSPLSLNIGSPMYSSLPGSPNCSPAISPAQRERLVSSYPKSPVNMLYSPRSNILQSGDPYLPNQMQISPSLPRTLPTTNDVEMMIPSNDFWMDSEMFQESNNLLSGLDDLKMV